MASAAGMVTTSRAAQLVMLQPKCSWAAASRLAMPVKAFTQTDVLGIPILDKKV